MAMMCIGKASTLMELTSELCTGGTNNNTKRNFPDNFHSDKCNERNEIGQYDNDWSSSGKLL